MAKFTNSFSLYLNSQKVVVVLSYSQDVTFFYSTFFYASNAS